MRNLGNNYAFIDSQNLNLGIKSLGWKIDWIKFRIFLKDKYFVSKAYLFIGYKLGNESLYSFLQEAGYICVFKPTLELSSRIVKGNVDAELVLHTMIELNNFDKAVIVSGDGDFYCLVEYLIKNNKLEELFVPNKNYSALFKKLSSTSDNILAFVSEQKNKIEYLARDSVNEKGSRRDGTL
ncbi:MAG: NYN domain-containing protein [Candidatus Paceibacterota bacterium]